MVYLIGLRASLNNTKGSIYFIRQAREIFNKNGLSPMRKNLIFNDNYKRLFSNNSIKFNTINNNGNKKTSIDWPTFLKIRQRQRYLNLIMSVFTGFIGSGIAWAYLSQVVVQDPTEPSFFGLDALTVMVIEILIAGAASFIVFGPVLGKTLWILFTKRATRETAKQKEIIFLHHIAKNRVNPRFQSMTNPVPDYYGEKIGSLSDYRRWLKDCKAYNRKANKFL